jgi:thioredoxin reductase (NADPH)
MQKTQLAIIGSGPAGYTAAIYASRAQLKPILFTGIESGGQLMYTTQLENFPGFPDGVMGPKFMMSLRAQAERFGTEIKDTTVTAVDFSSRPFKLWTSLPKGVMADVFKNGNPDEIGSVIKEVKTQPHDIETDAVIVATGASSIRLGVPGETEFFGRGVSVCAVCDAAFYRDKNVYVIGGGDSAMEDALALAKFAGQVTIAHRRDEFRASKIMRERVLNQDKIKVLWKSNLKGVLGDENGQRVTGVKIEVNGQLKEFPADGVFLAIGHKPVTSLFAKNEAQDAQLDLDQKGYVISRMSFNKAGVKQAQAALDESGLLQFPTMTSVEGVFAAGDVVDLRYKQAVTSAGAGCAAALDVERWLEE